MQWVSEGKRDREIAIILGLSSRTVEKHIGHIFEKLKVETRTAAASYCYYLATQHQKINTPIEDGG
jgi:DNA-binding CsgD family transcriptional regulator